jgi:lipopolysaccharide/colanic/teichoic acid biosynthesis glycosyltransferase
MVGIPYSFVKRILDVSVSAAALVIGAPVAALIAAAIRLSSQGPIIFSQKRVGKQGQPFTIYKFRTLPWDPRRKPRRKNDARWIDIAPPEAGVLGRFLRRTGLDEWPQFWNVLRGEMSVIGPRPERQKFAERFSREIAGYDERHEILPGITGLAQVTGLRGDGDLRERLACDLYYLEHCGFWLDCKILLLTPLSLLRTQPPLKDHARSV